MTFPAGITRVTLTIPVMDDLIDELDETFKLTVTSSASGVAIGSPDVTTILIKDDDGNNCHQIKISVINIYFSYFQSSR